jgi:thiol:disulfide interchange protein DsbC
MAIGALLLSQATIAQTVQSEPALPDIERYKESVKGGLETKGLIIGMQEMPISKLMFVEAEQGTYLVSSDGRFVIEGTVKDIWHRRTIRTLADVIETRRTPVSNIGFRPEEQLAHFVIGNQNIPRQGVAFVDPSSEYTSMFLKSLYEDKENVNWTVVLMPLVGGNASVDRSLRLWCSTDRDQAQLDFIFGTNLSFEQMKEGCNDEKIVMGMLLAEVFRITSLPHLIREDGLVSNGYPQDFNAWFARP